MVYGFKIRPVLDYLVEVAPLDGHVPGIRALDEAPDGGVDFHTVAGGRPCHTDHFPTRMEWRGPADPPIPDFDASNLLNVSARAREVIESIEPATHQFVPVDFVDRSGAVLAPRFFWVVCNRIDSMDHEKTSFVLINGLYWRSLFDARRRHPNQIPPRLAEVAESRYAFNQAAIGEAHVWRDKHSDLGHLWLSERFVAIASAADLTGITFVKVDGEAGR
jgi:hypothetical protein